ncbi:MAG: transposase, partial [Cyanobacteria bacterium J06632_19]
ASLPVRIYDLNAQQLITLWLDELSGLSDLEWKLFEDVFPPDPEKRGKGMPHVPYRHVLNSLLYILITGCRWCDLPRGEVWAATVA